eukprot:CAMPEP_0171295646 /NCGR_PEP_ID=MMETSP0816-20121228/4267_1 /TAXON_ID=420281 /ORGANISM="Proboscia inermis, Strain CCAP1064/1" /LENGTH=142 /DNA_ID=CAMNT_0011768483 /DNA_START=295 /DNA_END=722 /DNA_ORIENTATION=+
MTNPLDGRNTKSKLLSGGGELVSIHSKEELDYIIEISGGAGTIAGGRRTASNYDEWEWSDGSSWDYEIWNAGEPSNCCMSSCDDACGEETVLQIANWGDVGTFNDITTSKPLGAVYKRKCGILEIIRRNCDSLMNNQVFSEK